MRRASLLLSFTILAACGDDDPSVAAYERRIAAAEERVVAAICACLWTEELRTQCHADTEKYLKSDCLPELAQSFSTKYRAYAACLADSVEHQARCIEEADCKFHDAGCGRDAWLECGPPPADLGAELEVCLPPFTCATGQRVELTHRCDGVADCFDRSDEADCGNDAPTP